MKPTTLQPLDIAADDVDIRLTKQDVQFDYARDIMKRGRLARIELAVEIERLRSLYLKDRSSNLKKGKFPDFTNVKSGEADGFCAKLASELGMHPETAKRLIQEAEHVKMLQLVSSSELGKKIDYKDAHGEQHSIQINEAHQKIAAESLEELALPTKKTAGRAWAGVIGGGATKGVERKQVDRAGQVYKALAALNAHMGGWEKFGLPDRTRLAFFARHIGLEQVLASLFEEASQITPEQLATYRSKEGRE